MDFLKIKKNIIDSIRKFVLDTNFSKIIIGLSGGLDSSVVTYLCSEAVGSDKICGLYLPYGENVGESNNVKLVTDRLNLEYKKYSIKPLVDLYFKDFSDVSKIRKGNMTARQRMAILFDYSKLFNGLVVGTSNKSEILLGYFTIFGDSASSFAPIGDLYKTEVKELARMLNIPNEIIQQKPSAGLWERQTDEDELGFTYEDADKVLYLMHEEKYNAKQIIEKGFNKNLVEKIQHRVTSNAFKHNLPVIPKIK